MTNTTKWLLCGLTSSLCLGARGGAQSATQPSFDTGYGVYSSPFPLYLSIDKASATIRYTLDRVNLFIDAHTLMPDQIVTGEEIPVNIHVLIKDFDIGTASFASLPPQDQGDVIFSKDQAYTFVAANDFCGHISIFFYVICDKGNPAPVACTQGTIKVAVSNIKNTPIAIGDLPDVVGGAGRCFTRQ